MEKLERGLPAAQAEVVGMVKEGYSLEQVAEETASPLGTIRSRYRLAKQKMREKLRSPSKK